LADIFQIYFTKKRKVPTTTDTRKSIKNYKFQQWRATLEGRGCGEDRRAEELDGGGVVVDKTPSPAKKKGRTADRQKRMAGIIITLYQVLAKKKEAIKRVSFSDHYCSV